MNHLSRITVLLVTAAALVFAAVAGGASPITNDPNIGVTITSSKLIVAGAGFTDGDSVGVSFHYQPDGTIFGRTGNLNIADGQVQPGIYADTLNGFFEAAISRRQMITTTPGVLHVTVIDADGLTATETLEVSG